LHDLTGRAPIATRARHRLRHLRPGQGNAGTVQATFDVVRAVAQQRSRL